jgi:hypothetical protein
MHAGLVNMRGNAYLWLKIAKAQVPGVNRIRLLKTSPRAAHYDGREIIPMANGNSFLHERVASGEPLAAGKIGDTELEVLVKYEHCNRDPERFFRSISEGHELELLYLNCGVFPKRHDVLVAWVARYLQALSAVDLLGVWHNAGEEEIVAKYASKAILTDIRSLEPYYHTTPWSRALAGKRVTVVTPFAESIASQHARYRGKDLFPDAPSVLPDFELTVVRAPFSAGVQPPVHADWHTALDDLERSIADTSFDVCLIGAGAWSLPLCSFVRERLNRPAIHLGGALQILFGVRGKRWERHPAFRRLFNENWIRPLASERPKSQWKNDGGAYW